MAKHTPGPWRASVDISVKAGRFNVCPCVTAGGSSKGMIDEREVAMANARLIAAAPELLDALQAALLVIQDYLDYDHDGDPWSEDARLMGEMEINDYKRDGRLDAALTVITKATGQRLKGEE